MSKEFTSADAVIFAGGKGLRMGYLTEGKQKCLLPIGDKPILGHALDSFSQAFGSARITICVSYKAGDVIDYVNKNKPSSLVIDYVPDSGNSRLADIYRALKAKVQQPSVVTAGDIYVEPTVYVKAYQQVLRAGDMASITFSPKFSEADTHAAGKMKNSQIIDYKYPPPPHEDLNKDQYLRDINVWGLNQNFYKYASYYLEVGSLTRLLQQAIIDQEGVVGNLYEGQWIHLAYPKDLQKSICKI